MCKGQLLLCVEPAATRQRDRGADVCGNYDESLGTFIYMPLNLHLGPLEAKIKYLCCLLESVACHVGAPASFSGIINIIFWFSSRVALKHFWGDNG